MGQVLIRKLPDDVIGVLKGRARDAGRSLEQELRLLLIDIAKPPRRQLAEIAHTMRARLAGERSIDTLALLREMRES
jgi:plasmid stability protein